MAKHTHLSSTVVGITLSVVIAAGSMAYTSGASASVTGSAPPSSLLALTIPNPLQYTRRNIDRKGVPLRDEGNVNAFPTIKDLMPIPMMDEDTKTTTEACVATKKAVAKIRAVYDQSVPTGLKYTDIRQKLEAVFAAAVSDACPMPVLNDAIQSSSAAAKSMVDNNCEKKFPSHSTRYVQCMAAEKAGQEY